LRFNNLKALSAEPSARLFNIYTMEITNQHTEIDNSGILEAFSDLLDDLFHEGYAESLIHETQKCTGLN